MKIFIACFIALMLSGCASWFAPKGDAKPTVEESMKVALVSKAVAAAETSLFEMTCNPSCTFASLKIGNPGAAAQMAEIVKVVMTPQPSTGEKVALAFIDKGFGALGIGLITNGVKSFASSMFGSQTAIATSSYQALDNVAQGGFGVAKLILPPSANITTTNNIGGQGVIGNGQLSTVDNHTITNNTIPPPVRTCVTAGTPPVTTCTGG